jgi:23S rRNA pseudouridine1911/1915/1917 synthase
VSDETAASGSGAIGDEPTRTNADTEIVVGVEDAGQRLDVVVAARTRLPRAQVTARLRAGRITVDGAAAKKPSSRLHADQRIRLAAAVEPAAAVAPPPPPIRYRDDHLLVVAKDAGTVVHPGAGHPDGTLVDALVGAGIPLAPAGGAGRPGIVHRLDRDTSGLLMVAATDDVHAALVAALRARAVARRYLAVVDGVPAAAVGRIEAPVGRDPDRRTRFATVADGKPATTRYTTLAQGRCGQRSVALLACRLETGRTHQIRVHLTAIGHPVLGDPVYGPRPAMAARLGLARPFLHAARLAFTHPVTGEPIDLIEPLPDDLVAALAAADIAVPDLGEVLGDAPLR